MNSNDKNSSAFLIDGPNGALEVVVHEADPSGALFTKHLIAVICHPHPLHGGTMENKVVTTLARTYRDIGIKSIRFNFRGVGRSEGAFDHGVGELNDLMAVIDWCQHQCSELAVVLAGFSFGSSMAAQASYNVKDIGHLIMIAPPVERYPYDIAGQFPCAVCIAQGDKDERVSADKVYQWAGSLKGPVELLRYADASHFFHGALTQLKNDLTLTLKRQLE